MKKYFVISSAIIISALSLTLTACSVPEDTTRATSTTATTTAPGARGPASADATLSTTQAPDPLTDILSHHGLLNMDAVAMINHLDRLPVEKRPRDLLASIRHDELRLTTGSEEKILPLPTGQTYVSIAPYAERTHDCFYHSLTTCLGELAAQPVRVTIYDEDSGDVILDQDTITYDNGFTGFWLPTGLEGTIEVSHGGMHGSTGFSTREDGATCVTTLQMT